MKKEIVSGKPEGSLSLYSGQFPSCHAAPLKFAPDLTECLRTSVGMCQCRLALDWAHICCHPKRWTIVEESNTRRKKLEVALS